MNYIKQRQLIKKRSWLQRHPKIFFWGTVSSSLLIFFSRPIYDIFLRTDFAPPPLPKEVEKK